MIIIDRISNINPGQCHETWAIVRSFKGTSPWIQQVADLSPSSALFHEYQTNWKPNGLWNQDTFQKLYVPSFLRQIAQDEQAIAKLNELWRKDKAGQTIGLVCFCTDETLCHRSIVAGILQGVGCNVITRTGADYSHYWTQFQNLK